VTREDTDGKVYKKYPRMNVDGRKHRVTSIAVTKPREQLAEAYEERKAAFKDSLYEEVIEAHDDTADEQTEPGDVVQEVLDNDRVDEFVSHHGQTGRAYVDKDLLADEFGLSVRKSNVAKKKIEQQADIGE